MKRSSFPILILALLSLGLAAGGVPRRRFEPHDWLQFASPVLEGRRGQRNAISGSNVSRLATQWRVALPEQSDGAPVYVSNVVTQRGIIDLLILSTTSGRVIALDAGRGT